MRYTNEKNLPQAFLSLCERDEFEPDEKTFRATSLLKGTKEILLSKRHKGECVKDVSDMIWLLFGTAVHGVLESQKETEDEIKETRLEASVGNYTVSGQFDLYNAKDKKITDYKTASVYKIMKSDYTDWKKQLLIYAYMLRQIGFEVEQGEIVALLKDHSKMESKRNSQYPQRPVETIKFKFTDKDFAEIEQFLKDKFAEIDKYKNEPDDKIPECNEEERWTQAPKYAVMKKGVKKAVRLLDSEDEAKEYIEKNNVPSAYIEYRPGTDNKCTGYCDYCTFCNYYKEKYEC